MNINLYLNDKQHTVIAFFDGMKSNPFKVGSVIHLKVSDIGQKDYGRIGTDYANNMIGKNNSLQAAFNLKKIKLVEENIYARINVANDPVLAIDYYCEIVDEAITEKIFDRDLAEKIISSYLYYYEHVNELSIKKWLDVAYPQNNK